MKDTGFRVFSRAGQGSFDRKIPSYKMLSLKQKPKEKGLTFPFPSFIHFKSMDETSHIYDLFYPVS